MMPTPRYRASTMKHEIHVPAINCYNEQIKQCEQMCERLGLDRHHDIRPFPFLRSQTMMVTQPRSLSYSMERKARTLALRSAPPVFMKQESRTHRSSVASDSYSESNQGSGENDADENGEVRHKHRLDPDKLCELLLQRGVGLPSIVKSNASCTAHKQSLPRGFRARPLPRNPSKREKIKGRARLDQEMANMRALAFIEQQAPVVFRTASANMKNRDVQFVEDEMKEHMQREGFDVILDDVIDDDDDGVASIVRMPVNYEELFVRVNTWVTDVESSCKEYTSINQATTEHLAKETSAGVTKEA